MFATCSRCLVVKDVSDFYKRGNGKPQSWCKDCKKSHDRNCLQSEQRKESLRQSREIARQQGQEFIWNFLKNNPCVDCGESDIVVLEFDHLPGFKKVKNVSELKTCKLSTIRSEIAKCEVVCANCHKRRTAKRANWLKLNIIPGSSNG